MLVILMSWCLVGSWLELELDGLIEEWMVSCSLLCWLTEKWALVNRMSWSFVGVSFAALIGVGVVAVVWIAQKSKAAAYGLGGLGVAGLIVGILGMLNDGPLAKYLYKVSVTYRGDYWRAGLF